MSDSGSGTATAATSSQVHRFDAGSKTVHSTNVKLTVHFQFSGRLQPTSAQKYLAWEVAINRHRSNPDALVILGDSIKADDSIDFDLDSVSTATLVSKAEAVRQGGSVKMRPMSTASVSGEFDIAILSGMGPVAGAVLLLQIAQMSPEQPMRVLLYSRPRNDNVWHSEDDSFFRIKAKRYVVACNTFHAHNLPRMRALVGNRSDDIIAGSVNYIVSRFGRQPSRILLLGTPMTQAPSSPYATQMYAVNRHLKHPITLVRKARALNAIAWKSVMAVVNGERAKAVAFLVRALHDARHAGYDAVVLGCTEYSAAAHFAEEDNASTMDTGFIVDPLSILARRALGCGWRFSHALEKDYCECEGSLYCSSALQRCDTPIVKFPYLPGGFDKVDSCLSFMATRTFQQRQRFVAEYVNSDNVQTIVEVGAYRTPIANFMPGKSGNTVIIDPLCQSSNIAEAVDVLGSRATLLRADLEVAASHVEDALRKRASLGRRMLVFFGMQLSNQHQRETLVRMLNHTDIFIMEQAFSKKGYGGGIVKTWNFVISELRQSPGWHVTLERTFNFATLPKAERTICFHPQRQMIIWRRTP